MAEVSALRKHPCPECGGDAEWNPAKQALACPYCGTVLPWSDGVEPTGAGIVEHDLEQALASVGIQDRGLRAEKKSVKCESCRAISIFDPDRAAQRCDFCGSPAIVPVDSMTDVITPESLLPVVIPATQVRDLLRTWYRSRWWAPNKLKSAALTDTLHGIYLPYWTFDAHVDAEWTAESGYHYYVTETYRDSDGKTQTRQVQKTRWEYSEGRLAHFFDDDMVPGTVGIHTQLLRKVEPFPTTSDLKPYEPAFVRGWTVERYQVDLRQASQTSKQQMDDTIHQLCSRDVPGDTHRNLQVTSRYQGRTFKHILVPVWLATYTYGSKSFQVVANGYTGKMAGEHPLSWVKITLAILAALIVILIIVGLNQG
ncbi:zinc ribbon domain-containing protein [Luteolibacter yonseiensis]|uniref:Zinc ribbon domain-containing protein n=1 Tax=Luteolibacter yonseiensis TaxID=1144680 RepID=A0A934VBS2_9BACT|nr:zinc ribbon domain-containing protein [Luteolibacter yonseiensis]MBK1816410.1 zinc ribbon domain-containing protein [Luteolibacter yonseiensis]